MHEYRRYTNILWGQSYNPETQAHHCTAKDLGDACKLLPYTKDELHSTQVLVGDRWQWVLETFKDQGGAL